MTGDFRHRYLLYAALSAVVMWPIWLSQRSGLDDFYYFVFGSRALLGTMPHYTAGALHLYAYAPGIQVGPIPLLAMTPIAGLPAGPERAVWMGLIMGLGLITAGAIGKLAVVPWWRQVLQDLMILTAFGFLAWWSHLDDAMALTGIAFATAAIHLRRPWWIPALALGLAASCKPWAVIAAPMLLVLARRHWVHAAGVYVAAAIGPWLPFIAADPRTVAALGSVRQSVARSSGLRVFGMSPGTYAPANIHALMIAFGLLLGVVAVQRGKWQAVPFVALMVRPVLEPAVWIYYGAGPVVAALLWDVTRSHRLPWWTFATGGVMLGLPWLIPGTPLALAQVALAGVVIITLLANRAGQGPSALKPGLIGPSGLGLARAKASP